MRRSLAASILALAIAMTTLSPTLASASEQAPEQAPDSTAGSTPGQTTPEYAGVIKPDVALEATAQAREAARSALTVAARSLAGESPVSPSIALSELSASYDALTPPQQRRADALLARPTDDNSIDPGSARYPAGSTPVSKCRGNVCIQHITTGRHRPAGQGSSANQMNAWVERSLAEMLAVWRQQTAMGYRKPPADGGRGGTPEFDVYLADVGTDGTYGYCVPEGRLSDRVDDFRRSGYCVLDNDFTEFGRAPAQSLAVTAAHEFFHAIQFGYDASEDSWFKEATATWMEERYATSVNDNRQYLRHGQLGRPGAPLDKFGGLAHYGQWIFIEKLSKTYGVDIVRTIWQRLDSTPGARDEFSVQGLARVLANRGTTLPAFYAAFGAGNLAPAATYAEGAAYQAAPIAKSVTLRPARRQLRGWSARLPHLTTKSLQVRPAAALKGKWRLRVSVDGPARATGPGAHALVFLRTGKVVRKPITLDAQGRGAVRVRFTPSQVSRVSVTVANGSSRYTSCWSGTPFACSGSPRDNGQLFTVSARAVR